MQALLRDIPAPIAIILIVAGVLALVIVVLLARRLRRRQAPTDDSMGAASGLGASVDYTSLPLDDEPSGWRERFANLSLASKILVVLVPVLAVLGILVLVLTLLPGSGPQVAATAQPTLEPVSLKVKKADVVRVEPDVTVGILVETTGLPDGKEVTVELLEDGKPISFFRPDDTKRPVRHGRVEIEVQKQPGAAPAKQGVTYKVRVSEEGGQTDELDLTVLDQFKTAFYGTAVAAQPTPTLAPATATATEAPTSPDVTPTPSPTPATAMPSGPEVTIKNGGNVRALPAITAKNRVGGVDAGNKAQLIAQTPNGEWYQIRFTNTDNKQELLGWISASLVTISADVKSKIPVAAIVSVFKNGAVYERPDGTSTELDRVNRDEVVSLKQKTAAGDWYQVENVRGISGWVQAGLLGIPKEVAAKVPVAP